MPKDIKIEAAVSGRGNLPPLSLFLSRLGLVAALPALAAYSIAMVVHVRSGRELRLGNGRAQARALVRLVDQRLENILDGLRLLAASPELDDPADLSGFHLNAQRYRSVYGSHVILADVDSQMILNTRTAFGTVLPKLPVPRGHAAVPELLRTGRPSVGDSFVGPIAGETLVAAVVPVTRESVLRWLLLGTPETRLFQELLDAAELPENWLAFLHDSNGAVLAWTGAGELPGDGFERSYYRFSEGSQFSKWELSVYKPRARLLTALWQEGAGWLLTLILSVAGSLYSGKLYGRRLLASARALLLDHKAEAAAPSILEIRQMADKLRAIAEERDHTLRLLELFVDNIPAAIAMFDRDLRFLAYSRRFLTDYGLPDKDLKGQRHYDVFPDIPERWKELHQRCLAGSVERCERDAFPRADGRTDWVRWELRPWKQADGGVGGMVLFSEVITRAVEAENRIQRSSRQNELLLQELLHRTNNNMQIIQALMLLYSQSLPSTDLGVFVAHLTGRIEVMATVYRLIIDSEDLCTIDFAQYLGELAVIARRQTQKTRACSINLELEPAPLLFDVAVAIGIVALELVDLLCLRQVPAGLEPEIRIILHCAADDKLVLRVLGNGNEVNPDDIERQAFGLQLAGAIVHDQVRGNMSEQELAGCRGWEISFDDHQYSGRVEQCLDTVRS